MKYLRTYEERKNNYEGVYWKVLTGKSKKHFDIALKKIGITKDDLSTRGIYINIEEGLYESHLNYVYIASFKILKPTNNYEKHCLNTPCWDYSFKVYDFKNKGLRFMGVIKGEDYEVDAEKYNL